MNWVDLAVVSDGQVGTLAGEFADTVLSLAVRGGAGLVCGALLARGLYACRVHWSWALGLVGLALCARNPLGGLALPLGIAGVSAARRGRRWHRADLEDGADLSRAAAERVAPLHALACAVASRVAIRRRRADGAMRLGVDARGREVVVPAGGGRHALVLGATGSGKTVTQAALARDAISRGSAAIAIDPKGDTHLRETLRATAAEHGRPFFAWTPSGGAAYNPYERGSDTEIADKVLAGELFTEPHYLRQAQRYVGHVVRALRAAGGELSLAALAAHMDPQQLELLARSVPGGASATHDYLDSLTPRQRADLAGVRDRLAILAESDAGRWLEPAACAAPRLELLDAVRSGAAVYFNLEADRRPLLSHMLGAAIVQDLLTMAATLQGGPLPALVLIDEFSAVAARGVVRLFGRARSAGLTLVLGTQELADLRVRGEEGLVDQVLGNLSLLIAHRQVVPASVELVSRLGGVRGAWKVSRHSAGHTTRTRTQERVLAPEQVACLRVGQAAVIALSAGTPAVLVDVRASVPPRLRWEGSR